MTRDQIEELIAAPRRARLPRQRGFATRRAAVDRGSWPPRAARPLTPAARTPATPTACGRRWTASSRRRSGPGPVEPFRGGGLRGLIAPHIDFHRGGPAYAWAYRDLAERGDADLFVIFGTCHAGMARSVRADPQGLRHAAGAGARSTATSSRRWPAARGQDCFGSELAHRDEHSIEFQAVFLRYLFEGRRDDRDRPGADELRARGARPRRPARRTIRACRVPRRARARRSRRRGRRVALIAGADLAHVGPRFGDPGPVTAAELARDRARGPRRCWRPSRRATPPGSSSRRDATATGGASAGCSPIYALLRALGGARGTCAATASGPIRRAS